MKKRKILLTVATLALALLMFTACSGGVKIDGKKFDAIYAAYGDTLIVGEKGDARLYINGRAKGDKAYTIARLGESGYYKAEKTPVSGYYLMDKDGKILNHADGVKVTDISDRTNYYTVDDKYLVGDYQTAGFIAKVETKEKDKAGSLLQYAVMAKSGAVADGRYSNLSNNYSEIFIGTKSEEKTPADGSTLAENAVKRYALKADGSQIAAVWGSVTVRKFSGSNKAAAFVAKDETDATTGNGYDLYSSDGNLLGQAFSSSVDTLGKDTLAFTRKTAIADDTAKTYFLKDDFTSNLSPDYSSYCGTYKDVAYYYQNSGTDAKMIMGIGGPSHGPYNGIYEIGQGALLVTVGVGDIATKKVIRLDGTLLLDGLKGDAQVLDYAVYGEEDSDKYDLIVKEDAKVTAKMVKEDGTSVTNTYTLADGESISTLQYGCMFAILSDAPTKMWIPATGAVATASISLGTYDVYEFIQLTVGTGDDAVQYLTTKGMLRNWNGQASSGNLLSTLGA
ncbi:MAG: hypothetical protein LBL66_05720, partial [Clostridiales bacterium]|nr:hypothetical protein [Clostridiales bacterium]